MQLKWQEYSLAVIKSSHNTSRFMVPLTEHSPPVVIQGDIWWIARLRRTSSMWKIHISTVVHGTAPRLRNALKTVLHMLSVLLNTITLNQLQPSYWNQNQDLQAV